MMNIEIVRAYPKSHFGPCRANGTLGVKNVIFSLNSEHFVQQVDHLGTKGVQI